MKTVFELECSDKKTLGFKAEIIGRRPESRPYVSINLSETYPLFIKDKDLERFAVNILKSLNSKHLRP